MTNDKLIISITNKILAGLEMQQDRMMNEKVMRLTVEAVFGMPKNAFDVLVGMLIAGGYIARDGENLKSLRIA